MIAFFNMKKKSPRVSILSFNFSHTLDINVIAVIVVVVVVVVGRKMTCGQIENQEREKNEGEKQFQIYQIIGSSFESLLYGNDDYMSCENEKKKLR